MKLDPPMLTRGPLSGKVYVVTHGKVRRHLTVPDRTIVIASVKYDVTDQYEALKRDESAGGSVKAQAIEVAARAEFEATKASVVELEEVSWDRLSGDDNRLASMLCKEYYRSRVRTGVEALHRQGFLCPPENRIAA